MAKFVVIFICLAGAILGSSQSVSFECQYYNSGFGTLGTIYFCSVKDSITITSIDASHVDDISGTHRAGYNNYNVEGFVIGKGQTYYFPRGLNNFFPNLKGIQIGGTRLKEIHKSDLKPFPNLKNLYLHSSSLEVLEENLFEFNPDLENIYMNSNKIIHIDPNVFDKLTKLKSLDLNSNTCINLAADANPTQVQNIIKAARAQCINSDYSNLDRKVKNLEAESKNLNYENLKEKLENLEKEIKNSKFLNFFRDKPEGSKAVLAQKELGFILASLKLRTEKIEQQNENIENKMAKIEEMLVKIMKALNISD